jgi:hypothetical protein
VLPAASHVADRLVHGAGERPRRGAQAVVRAVAGLGGTGGQAPPQDHEPTEQDQGAQRVQNPT